MASEIVNGKAMIDGHNVFSEINSLGQLVGVFAGFASMCWENPAGAGEFNGQNANAGANAFVERAHDILWTRMYQKFVPAVAEWFPEESKEQIDERVSKLVRGMDLWG